MMRNIVISGVLLALFGVVGTALVAFVYQGTADRIAANIEAAILNSLHDILSHEAYDNDILADSVLLSHELLGDVICGPTGHALAGSRWRLCSPWWHPAATADPSACWWASARTAPWTGCGW